jgi:N-acetylmuramoyl-L-alanine amidase
MIDATKSLIEYSLQNGYLFKNFKILGHRQVRTTECPGQRLFDEISKWNHFSKIPYGPNDTQIPKIEY